MESAGTAMPCRILVIDDDPISLGIAALLLEAEGCAVLQAESGEDALELLGRGDPPECVLADLRMPGLCGPDLAVRLRSRIPAGLRATLGRAAEPTAPEDAAPAASGLLDEATFERLRRSMPAAGLAEVVDAFLHDTVARIADMRSAAPETICRQAHTVKGGAAMLGAVQVSTVASVVEAGIDQPGERLRKLDELEFSLRETEVILKQRLKI